MELSKNLLHFAALSFFALAVEGCGRLKCYQCNSQDSPNTCGESNFDSNVHADDVVSGSVLRNTENAGTSCVRGWTTNDQGTYYYRDKFNKKLWDGCSTPELCACNEDLCNSRGSQVTTSLATTSLLFCALGVVLVKKMMI
ncbi:uncharacterized protein LOC123560383 isoform X1 [Mercenaria mercenaria]|uniref:uncharacterized protein LOC123560383 isoform X1 n=1 Tax=Mercenaria mercenaria TaxID=6596 RepID=UPI00234F3460|nr:uncharacterized protein LOC123560383 isoform X1 [Mercenaria mercenaria]